MSGLDASIAHQEFLSSVGYWILVAGLIGDILVLAIPAHRGRLEKSLSAIFTVIIIVGVAIEHRADSKIAALVSQEETSTALRVAGLTNDAAIARRDAAQAMQKAEQDRLARIKIEEKIAPRSLSSEQQASIATKLRPLALIPDPVGVPERVDIAVFPVTSEATRLANQIKATLEAAGWNSSVGPQSGESLGVVFGVAVLKTPDSQKSLLCATALSKALAAERVSAFVGTIPRIGSCKSLGADPKKDPYCARILVLIGDHP